MMLRVALAVSAFRTAGATATTLGGARTASTAAGDTKVGFLGLGALGLRMARRLAAAGNHLIVYDSNELAVERLLREAADGAAAGGSVVAASCPAEVAATRGVSVVFTVLPDAGAVRAAYLGKQGLLSPPGGVAARVMVDCTTLDPPNARKLAGRVRAARVHAPSAGPPLPGLPAESPCLLDAPVSGGVVGAEAGTLSFLVGGEEAARPAVEPLLAVMGRGGVTWCGDTGDAQAARLCNSLVQAASMAATSEALALARRLGVRPEVMSRVLNAGSGRSWASAQCNPVPGVCPDAPASNGYRGGLRCSQVASHLGMAVAAAERAHSPVPVARLALQLYEQVVEEGLGDQASRRSTATCTAAAAAATSGGAGRRCLARRRRESRSRGATERIPAIRQRLRRYSAVFPCFGCACCRTVQYRGI